MIVQIGSITIRTALRMCPLYDRSHLRPHDQSIHQLPQVQSIMIGSPVCTNLVQQQQHNCIHRHPHSSMDIHLHHLSISIIRNLYLVPYTFTRDCSLSIYFYHHHPLNGTHLFPIWYHQCTIMIIPVLMDIHLQSPYLE